MSTPYETDFEPEIEELQQRETEENIDTRLTVRVDEVSDAVRVHVLPKKIAVMHSATVTDRTDQLYGKDMRRARAVVWATAAAATLFYVGTRSDEVEAGTAAQALAVKNDGTQGLPQMIPFENTEPLYVRSAGEALTVSFVLEQWAD